MLVSSHLLSEVEQICTARRRHARGPARGAGSASPSCGSGAAPRARVETDQAGDAAARVLRELGLTDVLMESGNVSGTLGQLAPEKVVAALVHDGVPVMGFAVSGPAWRTCSSR